MNRPHTARDAVIAFFGSARLTSALSVTSITTGMLAFALHQTIGWAGLIGILATLTVLCGTTIVARRDSVDWVNLMPLSLLAFLVWAGLSIGWSQYQWATLGGLAYLAAFTALGLFVALMRDTIQIIRDFGDSLRFVLLASLVLEVFAGLLIDSPIPFLSISASLDHGGPISGLVGNRNDLGLLAVIAGISFFVEWRTKSVTTGLASFSMGLATITLILTGSPIAWGTAFVATTATVVLYGIRRLPIAHRTVWLFAALGMAVIGAIVLWLFRTPVIAVMNASGELEFRLQLWDRVSSLIPLHPVEGWGWIGAWHHGVPPFPYLDSTASRPVSSALNAYLDVWFQLGVIGLALFLMLLGLAFVRSWLLAARKRSVIFTWPAIVLAALLTAALAESSILTEFGWLTFVICCVKASQQLSWRTAFQRPLEPEVL